MWRRRVVAAVALAALAAACHSHEEPWSLAADSHMLRGSVGVDLPTADAVEARIEPGGVIALHGDDLIWQVGLRGAAADDVVPRVSLLRGGVWSEPVALDVTWRETPLVVARLLLDAPAEAVRLVDAAAWSELWFEAHDRVWVDPDAPLARELPVADDAEKATLPAFVVTRTAWGARSPGLVCGDPHTPNRITIHHTDTPTVDSVTVAQRLRNIQAYHIDSNGWCDIGYHFLVGQDGRVYQGRSSEERTGAHAGGANADNVGVSLIGSFGTQAPSSAMIDATVTIVRWIGETFDIAFDRRHIFGHREVGTTSTTCPGNALFALLPSIAERAGGGVAPDAGVDAAVDAGADTGADTGVPATYAMDVQTRTLLTDRMDDGASSGVADALQGESFEFEVLLRSGSSVPLRGVQLGYAFDAPYFVATGYRIESDHPAYDRATWTVNSADSDPANPPRDALGASGVLEMHAFSPRETKRVVFTVRAAADSVGRRGPGVGGRHWHASMRAWLAWIPDVYGPQERFGAAPGLNAFGAVVETAAEVDVLGTAAWFFDGQGAGGLEGWTSCNEAALGVSTSRGALELDAPSTGVCADSPVWTDVPAAYDELVVVARAGSGPTVLDVSWQDADGAVGEGELRLGGGTFEAALLEVPRGAALRSFSLTHGPSPDSWVDVDAVWFQDTETRTTSSDRAPYLDGSSPIGPLPGEDAGGDASTGGDVGFDIRVVDATGGDAGVDVATGADARSDETGGRSDGGRELPDPSDRSGRSGCAVAGEGPVPTWPLLLLALLGAAVARRRDRLGG